MRFSAKDIMNSLSAETGILRAISPEETNAVQHRLLAMLVDIMDVCAMEGIGFCLCGGSALGAKRHGGFIPWDDDLDICMPRADWERFKRVFDSSLSDRYELEAPAYGGKDTKCTWGKVYLKGTEMLEIEDVEAPYCCGLFIDVFIVENVSVNGAVRWFDAFVSDFMKVVATSIVYYKYPNAIIKSFYSATFRTAVYYRFRKMLGGMFAWIGHRRWCRWYDRFTSRHGASALTTIPAGRRHYKGETRCADTWTPYRTVVFEGVEVPVPNRLEAYLESMYGKNYMQIPPPEKRERHFVVRLKI